METQNLIVLVLVAAASAYVIRAAWRWISMSGSCHCGCGESSPKSNRPGKPTLKKIPLVELKQVSTPYPKAIDELNVANRNKD